MTTLLRGHNSTDLRERNSRLILRTVFHYGPVSRREISRLTGLTAGTISVIVNRLVLEGILREVGMDARPPGSRGGPREVLVDLHPQGAAVFAIALGVRSRSVTLVGPRGHCFAQTMDPTVVPELSLVETLDWIGLTARDLVQQTGIPPQAVVGAGVAFEGLVNPITGVGISAPYRPWGEVSIVSELRGRLGIPVVAANPAHAIAVGEAWFGQGYNASSQVLVKLGTTVSCAVVVRQEVVLGNRQAAGAMFGHVVVRPGGEPCICGRRGCLETVAGDTAVIRSAREAMRDGRSPLLEVLSGGQPERVTGSLLARAASEGDPGAVAVVQEAGTALGLALGPVVSSVDPSVVIVEGYLPGICGELFLEPVRSSLSAVASPGSGGLPPVVACSLGAHSPSIGAAALALERFFYSPQLDQRGTAIAQANGSNSARADTAGTARLAWPGFSSLG